MKKIGILFGQERSFPMAFIEKINSKGIEGITAEAVRIDKAPQGEPSGYAVIVDRISQDVPFYRTWLKNAAVTGSAVINNPFWWSADDKYFNNCLMSKIGVPVPKTVILPSYELPTDTKPESFANLAYPLDWDSIFNYIGFPAYMKPYAGGGWKNVYKLNSREEFYHRHTETEQLVMLLQEEIQFTEYYRCYCIGRKYVHIMPYEPRNPFHLRYSANFGPTPELLKQMEEIVLRINEYLGYDFNTVELALRDGVPYAIDFCNPAPDADPASVGPENFEWVVENAANYAIERAMEQRDDADNLTWGAYVKRSAAGEPLVQE
jgi:glutathione synthase/RimK-type ligase-like ATP-grasp enzyme